MKANGSAPLLKTAFLIGAVGDGLIAVEWFAISLGWVDLPIHPSFYHGDGQDYRYVVSIGGIFMLGWGILLWWGSRRPVERRGLLLLTAGMLCVAILSNGLLFGHLFTATQIAWGTSVKLALVVLFVGSYWHSSSMR